MVVGVVVLVVVGVVVLVVVGVVDLVVKVGSVKNVGSVNGGSVGSVKGGKSVGNVGGLCLDISDSLSLFTFIISLMSSLIHGSSLSFLQISPGEHSRISLPKNQYFLLPSITII